MKTIFLNTHVRRMMTLVLCLLTVVPMLFAWGQKGHRIVAQIAYDNMNAHARAFVDSILGPGEIVGQANWPDEIKSDSNYTQPSSWHFQDLNAGMTDSMLIATLTDYPDEGGYLFMAMDSLLYVLGNKDEFNKRTLQQQQEILKFIIHLEGDFFCPMHTAHLDDLGGNRVSMRWFGQNTNLHTVWDSKLIESQGYSYTEYSDLIQKRYGHTKDQVQAMSKEDALRYNYRLTGEIYEYQAKWNGNTYHYIYNWKHANEKQLYMAGVRLAFILNKLLVY